MHEYLEVLKQEQVAEKVECGWKKVIYLLFEDRVFKRYAAEITKENERDKRKKKQ